MTTARQRAKDLASEIINELTALFVKYTDILNYILKIEIYTNG